MQIPQTIEIKGIRVLTTRQLAEAYGTVPAVLNNNFYRNKDRYVLGKHYISVMGDEMKVLRTSHQNDGEFKRVSKAYLWTEKGALLHAKSLNTDKAWQVYDYLVDFYFRSKEQKTESSKPEAPKPVLQKEKTKVVSVDREIAPDFREIIQSLPIETLDEMEKAFRGNQSRALKLAETSILAEKMKRALIEDRI